VIGLHLFLKAAPDAKPVPTFAGLPLLARDMNIVHFYLEQRSNLGYIHLMNDVHSTETG